MEKTIKINIAGVVFEINEDAFELLRNYLQSINNRLKDTPGGAEMIEDIETRIAEIFQASPSWKTGVISREEVEEMKETMGSPDEIAGDLEEVPYYERAAGGKRLYRDPDHQIIGGVCSGLGAYLRIDPVWIRIIFVLFSIVYLSGLFVYIILWIALPGASSPSRKKELYDDPPRSGDYAHRVNQEFKTVRQNVRKTINGDSSRKVGNAFNEVFRAFGKFFIILFRVIIAIIGVAFIVSGFSLIFSFMIVGFFNGTVFAGNVLDAEIFHLPDFLSFIVDPALTPWLLVLSSIVIILPLLGMIYWGIRMVFQFRARDLVLNLAMFIIWVLSCTALSLLLFSEGISFSNSGRVTENIQLETADTLFLRLGEPIATVDYDSEVHLPFEDFALYLDKTNRTIYGLPEINIYSTDSEARLDIVKYSNGRTRADAREKADNLIYDFDITDKSVWLNEYFTIPEGNRWSGAYMRIRIYLPEGTVVFVEEDLEDIFDSYLGHGVYSYELGNKYWKITEDGLKKTD